MEKISKSNIVRILCLEGKVQVESPLDPRDTAVCGKVMAKKDKEHATFPKGNLGIQCQ